jgi:lipopolysaccharide transport system ATP-binding protein
MKNLSIEGLGKRYWLKAKAGQERRTSRLDAIRSFFSIPLARDLLEARELWALRDVAFDVDGGEVVGIVGPNGAGKSTLLKIVAKVIAPTTGRVRGRGRLVSLLELGAGFDDEATARENIFMNAALNGIPRSVVQRRLDHIIDFAGLQEFVDTELKFFSSGMYLRLAFSVAINMEPSILLADEILAVGDLAFQERCLEKVRELARDEGLTVLFVSHDMEAVSRICDRVIWLKGGEMHQDGAPESVVTAYQNAAWAALAADAGSPAPDHGVRYGEILEVKLLSADGREIGSPPRAEDVYIRIRFRTRSARTRARCAVEVHTKGVLVFRSTQPELVQVKPERVYEALAKVPANLLSETTYTVNAGVTLVRGEEEEYPLIVNKALAFMVYGAEGVHGSGTLHRPGVVSPSLEWQMEEHAIPV